MLWKEKLRPYIYRYSLLKIIWREVNKYRYQLIFKYQKHKNNIHYFYLVKYKGYKTLTFEKEVTNGVFKVFVSKDNKSVLKVNRKDNFSNYNFYKDLKNDAKYKKYNNILCTARKMEFIGSHILPIEKTFRDGSYISSYIDGENLKILKMKLLYEDFELEGERLSILLKAIEHFYKNVNAYKLKYGILNGDWMLHNLVFDESTKKIYNVDLEGFYTFRGNGVPNNILMINYELNSVMDLLKTKFQKDTKNNRQIKDNLLINDKAE